MKQKTIKIFVALFVLSAMLSGLSANSIFAASKPALSEKKVTIYSDQKDYTVKVNGVTKKATIRFYSSDKSVLKIGKKNGKVTPIKEGSAKVTVKVKQNNKTYKLKTQFTVISRNETSGKTATCAGFSEMMGKVIEDCDPSLVSKWNKVAKKALKNTSELRREDADLILYEAACVLGIGQGTAFWCNYQLAYDNQGLEFRRNPKEDLFDNLYEISPFECFLNENAGNNYQDASVSYSYGNSSPADPEPFFGRILSESDAAKILTVGECETAAQRLKTAYECAHEGYFNIKDYETDWSDERLKTAYELKESILNSETKIVKSDKFIQGETYSGTAYYVSNNGNDENDGLSPETPWASMQKVNDATLQFGDAVFFERGGRWYGTLRMQTGVTYSAYGEGAKPIWTGSPLDAAESSNWIYYGETNDGGKIWRYKEKQTDCGLILLNNEIIARKYYAVWNGKEYRTFDGKKKFNLKRELSSDLMYYSDIDITGYDVPCSPWSDKIKGYLYFRCDKGNPGDVFDSIELSVTVDSLTTAEGGYNTIDNISYRFLSLDCNCNSNIIYQNCEVCWVGGSVQSYKVGDRGQYITGISGGGMLLFGSNLIGRNNYIHDCENKGIAVVINGDGHHSNLVRKNILAENNVVERCGMSVYMMTEFVEEGKTTVFEDITLKNNYFINSGKGWRAHSEKWVGNGWGTLGDGSSGSYFNTISRTGKVIFEDNLYYGSEGPYIQFQMKKKSTDSVEFKDNRFILPDGCLVYDSYVGEDDKETRILNIGTKEQIEKEIKKYIGKNSLG